MDIWSIAGNIAASIIVGIAVFLFGRWQGWWAQAKAKRLRAKADDTKFAILVADLDGDATKPRRAISYKACARNSRRPSNAAIFKC